MATHSSIPAWRISWTEEPGRLQSMGKTSKEALGAQAWKLRAQHARKRGSLGKEAAARWRGFAESRT